MVCGGPIIDFFTLLLAPPFQKMQLCLSEFWFWLSAV